MVFIKLCNKILGCMHSVRSHVETLFFKIVALVQKNRAVDLFKLFVLDVYTLELYETVDNSKNVL